MLEKFSKGQFEKLKFVEPFRADAFSDFERLGLPTPKDEAWKYTDLSRFDLNACAPLKKMNLRIQEENVDREEEDVSFERPKDPFEAFSMAFGTLHRFSVEKNKKARIWMEIRPEASGGVLNHVRVGLGAHLEYFSHGQKGTNALVSEKTVFELSEGARADAYRVQRFERSARSFSIQEFRIGKNAAVKFFSADAGSFLSRNVVRQHFDGDGAFSTNNKHVYFGGYRQHVDLTTEALHHGKNTQSNILVKGVLGQDASSVYRGIIRIDKQASKTNSYLQDRVVHLGKNAISNSIPSLYIDNNDVVASHGATVSNVSPDALFYLQSRGLSKPLAQRLIVDGFLEEALLDLPDEKLKSVLHRDWEEKLDLYGR
ncbi:MAG TPA: SufD family Fe-S cluster assembly protein [Candidatus Norongarragalinales archaeon]|nr:SufD family Fe-S cluster assembly protein [Candidatus Norongarragalinales archaeon]